MTNKEAIATIKANWPSERYSMLRQALSKAIRSLEREDQRSQTREEKTNAKEFAGTNGRRVSNVSDDRAGNGTSNV